MMRKYVRLKQQEIRRHRLTNVLQTLLLLCSMSVFLGLVGSLLAGLPGILWAVMFGLMSYWLSLAIAPGLMLKLYRAHPISTREAYGLYQIVQSLAERAGIDHIPRLYYVPSPMLNAFTVNLRGQAVIGITDGLLRTLDGREIVGVLAHEIGHIRHRYITVMSMADIISRMTQAFSMTGHQEPLAPCKPRAVERQVSANQRPVVAVFGLPGSRPLPSFVLGL